MLNPNKMIRVFLTSQRFKVDELDVEFDYKKGLTLSRGSGKKKETMKFDLETTKHLKKIFGSTHYIFNQPKGGKLT